MQNNRLSNVANSIQHHLVFARSQSISLINYITVCPLKDNECTNNWITGLDVFIDRNQSKTLDDGAVLLKSASSFNTNDELVFPAAGITYTPDGQITGNAAQFRYCAGNGRIGVSIAYSGRAKIIDGSSFTDCE